MKDMHKIEIIANENGQDSISVDESLFIHDNQKEIWVIGMINNRTREIRLEISENRTIDIIKKIIGFHIPI